MPATQRTFVGTRRFYPASDDLGTVFAGMADQSAQTAARLGDVPFRVDSATVGLMFGMFSREDGFTYLYGAEVENSAHAIEPPAGMVTVALPAQRYLVFPTTDEEAQATDYTVWFEWLPASPYMPAVLAVGHGDQPDFIQRYPAVDSASTGAGVVEAHFPIAD